jgi:GH25 family lysozyme M1 (1,4-beta-N-acetylmuramidase)
MKIIDISEHNGTIDFTKVKQDGIDGVIIRVGWIGNKENHTIDKYFEQYYQDASKVGLKIGFYVYSYCKSQQAIVSGTNWFLNKIFNKQCDLACFLDLEDPTIEYLDKEELTRHAEIFCEMTENNLKKAGVYASEYWFKYKMYIDRLITYKIWLAKWVNNTPKENFRYDLWQYTSDGKVNGINTNVDLNECIQCENTEQTENKESDFEMKIYQNGSTIEPVYQDILCTKEIGYLHEWEQAECYGIIDGVALIVYNKDKKKDDEPQNKKSGFVKWLGGVK